MNGDPLDPLDALAARAGIELTYVDYWGVARRISPAVRAALLSALGYHANDALEAAARLEHLEARAWRRRVEPVTVVGVHRQPATIAIVRERDESARLAWNLVEEGGAEHEGELDGERLALLSTRTLDGRVLERRAFALPRTLPLGYHRLRVHDRSEVEAARAAIIVVPPACYLPPALEAGRRLWGLSAQLYGLRSEANWGIGDLGDLRRLAEIAADAGAGVIGISPLHALDACRPEAASPYSPSSRLMLNALFVDVEGVPDLAESAEARRFMEAPDFARALAAQRAAERVDYGAVAQSKHAVLRLLYASFRRRHLDGRASARGAAFRRFVREHEQTLERWGTYHALAEDVGSGDWRTWPAAYRDPAAAPVVLFAKTHRERVEYHQYVQWLADEQLAAAGGAAQRTALGLYRDLAVAADAGGADGWMHQRLQLSGVHVGAPPDPLNHRGQDWGLAPWDPDAMREDEYASFVALLRANMRHTGVIRLDHVMALARLYWIPEGAAADEGAYVRYPFEDLLGLVALESVRNRCIVVGEDLGTIPSGMRERLAEARLLSCRLLYFEHDAAGQPRAPEAYPQLALVSTGTHDLPSLAAFWRGSDIDLRERIGLYRSPEEAEAARRARARERLVLAAALGVRAPEEVTPAAVDDEELVCRAYAYLARTPALILAVQLEDVCAQLVPVNVPGTGLEQPNWRERLPLTLEELAVSPRVRFLADLLSRERPPAG
ncbi:MAG TPA: 4-alpha-glucanotransferase [Candidatus Dormibacteraeota bacterium]|nr:4-alpha-glucanotransferase [Candidatus Dormibacteraeota bacterium]